MKFSQKKISYPIYFLSMCLFFSACEKDFSVTSENREPFSVVYGLLDIADKEHYVKIYKSYLTEGNAYDFTTDIHKYSYIDSIEVYLEEYNGQGDIVRKIIFDTTTSIPKNSGLFGHPTQILYKADAVLNSNYSYKLVVYNPYTKNRVETREAISLASAPIIDEPQRHTNVFIPDDLREFKFITGKNATKYVFRLKYFYTEDVIGNASRQPEPVIWTFGEFSDKLQIGGVDKVLRARGSDFFKRISVVVKEDPNVYRRHTDSIVYEIYVAAKDWDLYQQSTIPPIGANRDQLYYSNLKSYNIETNEERHVLGFFSSKTTTSRYYRDFEYPSTRDSLFKGRFTGQLNFTDIY